MKNRYILRFALMSLVLISSALLSGQFSGGRGIDYDPFIIANADDLNLTRDYPNSYFKQSGDISLDEEPWNRGEGWEPIGTIGRPFYGSYDGDNYKITGLYINRESQRDTGLFGFIHDANITNIILEDVDITGFFDVGGLVGYTDYSVIRNCYVSGKITGVNYYVGGLVGLSMYSIINDCKTSAEVSGHSDVGGLVGSNTETTINRASSIGSVTGGFVTGGLVGNNYTLGGCGLLNTGGLAGFRNGTYIVQSYATGNVNGGHTAGGLVGKNENAFIYDSYAMGSVDGISRVGGLIGDNNDGTVERSYSTGIVSGEQTTGGLIGYLFAGRILRSYWDTESSQMTTSPAGEPRTTNQMTHPYDANTYVNWDFIDTWNDDPENSMNNGYPVLKWQIPVINPFPNIASEPSPEDNAADIAVTEANLQWTFIPQEGYTPPVGFRIYFKTGGDFSPEDEFFWVDYIEDESRYSTLLDEYLPLDYDTDYYWMVVPTINHPDEEYGRGQRFETLFFPGDAEDTPVWTFRTEVDTSVKNPDIESTTSLYPNYPNPFNPSTTISFSVADGGEVSLDVYDSRGRKIVTLHKGYLPAGNHSVNWYGIDAQGNNVGSGVYFYRMKKGIFDATGKMILIK